MCTGIGEPVAIVNHCNLVRVNLNYAFYYVEVDKTGPKKKWMQNVHRLSVHQSILCALTKNLCGLNLR